MTADDTQKLIEITWLAHEVGTDIGKFGGKAGQKDERRCRGAEQPSRAREQFPAVHPGHAEIANDERGRRFSHHAECRDAPGRGRRYVAGALEHVDDGIAIVLVIVDDQNPFRHRRQAGSVHHETVRNG